MDPICESVHIASYMCPQMKRGPRVWRICAVVFSLYWPCVHPYSIHIRSIYGPYLSLAAGRRNDAPELHVGVLFTVNLRDIIFYKSGPIFSVSRSFSANFFILFAENRRWLTSKVKIKIFKYAEISFFNRKLVVFSSNFEFYFMLRSSILVFFFTSVC